jgi:hypothetical protein
MLFVVSLSLGAWRGSFDSFTIGGGTDDADVLSGRASRDLRGAIIWGLGDFARPRGGMSALRVTSRIRIQKQRRQQGPRSRTRFGV